MTRTHSLLAIVAGGLAAVAGAPASAQNATAATSAHTDVSACTAIESDKERLACYDGAAHRQSTTPATADAAATQARQQLKASSRNDSATGGDLYAMDADDAIANAGKGSLLDSRWELAKDSKLGTWNFRAYKPVYLLPAFWTSAPNTLPHSPNPANTVTTPQHLQNIETKFQLSFKTKAIENLFGDNGDVWMGYTQSSRWQVYNSGDSRPFRETNYEPEVLLVFRTNYQIAGWKGRLAGIGVNHQSNGRADPLSRSWNRVMMNVGFDRENWSVLFRPWYRIPESFAKDDNPDIEDYMGRGDVTVVHTVGRNEFSLMARHSLRGGDRSHGALQFDWGFPITRKLRGHFQLFDGYGESMIDYNHRATYVGLGVSLMEWY